MRITHWYWDTWQITIFIRINLIRVKRYVKKVSNFWNAIEDQRCHWKKTPNLGKKLNSWRAISTIYLVKFNIFKRITQKQIISMDRQSGLTITTTWLSSDLEKLSSTCIIIKVLSNVSKPSFCHRGIKTAMKFWDYQPRRRQGKIKSMKLLLSSREC